MLELSLREGGSWQQVLECSEPGIEHLVDRLACIEHAYALWLRACELVVGRGHCLEEALALALQPVRLKCALALARRRAYEPRWWLSLRHALAEAGFRASATWAEFTDWLRLGH